MRRISIAALYVSALLAGLASTAAATEQTLGVDMEAQLYCDDQFGFDGANGGVLDTVSGLRFTFDASRRLIGYFRTSVVYRGNVYAQGYEISGHAAEDGGKTVLLIDGLALRERAKLPEGLLWRDLKSAAYDLSRSGGDLVLDGSWQDVAGGRGVSRCS